MKFSRFFTILAIGSIGYCLTSVKNDPGMTVKEKQCYVSKKKQQKRQMPSASASEKIEP